VHGKSGLDGATLPAPKRVPVDVHAVDFIIEMAHRHRGELLLATIGPETNVALALRREPLLSKWLREITVMGGSTTGGNITPAAEFNIYCDPEAAWTVFNSGIPIRMAGYNVTRRTGFDQSDIDRLRASGRRVAGVVADLMAFYLDRQKARYGLAVAPMHDVCALVPYVDDTLIEYCETRVEIELTGTRTRGMTVCDLRHVTDGRALTLDGAPNARVALDADSRRLIDLVLDTVLTYP
jgi:inosine-uridine nucleoside N-ribohydrolase